MRHNSPLAVMTAVLQIQLPLPGIGLGTAFAGSIHTACQGCPSLVKPKDFFEIS